MRLFTYFTNKQHPPLHVAHDAMRQWENFLPYDLQEAYDEIDKIEPGIASATVEVFEPRPLTFEHGQPSTFDENDGNTPYRGQDAAKRLLLLDLMALEPGERMKALFTGSAGTGKTTFARILAAMIQRRHVEMGMDSGSYFELLPSQVETKPMLDAFMQRIVKDPQSIIFIDEIHTLKNLETLFHTLHDSGETKYPMSDGSWLLVPKSISWLTATTDPGELDQTTGGAMRRRLEPEIVLEPPTIDVLASIVMDSAKSDGMSMHPDAAWSIAERSLFPFQAKAIYGTARKVVKVAGDTMIQPNHSEEAFVVLEIDKNGLRRPDRAVIRELLRVPVELVTKKGTIRYRMSEEALCSAAGIDRASYKKRVQPKLMRLGLLQVIGGQCLTEKAVSEYGWLKNV